MFLFPQEFDSVTVRLINNMNEIEYVNVRADMTTSHRGMPEDHFTTRNILIRYVISFKYLPGPRSPVLSQVRLVLRRTYAT